jgi:CubicO group peptidase (beta-lactamase class C family)
MKAVRDLMERGVRDGVFPGGVLLVAKEGRLTFFQAFGLARLTPERLMTTDTVFDLASLTKPLATTVALMLLVQQGKLNLDQTLGKAIPDFSGTDKTEITIRQLLCHTSGLPDYRPYYETLMKHPAANRKSVLRTLLSGEDLIYKPGAVCLYSDLGFMILEWLVETAAETPLDRLVQESVYKPLGLKHLFFIPLTATQTLPFEGRGQGRGIEYAATEDCPWRGKILDGEVHDDNAYALGGVAGHAGLFGRTEDVYGLLKELLNVCEGKPNSGLFRRDVVETFFERQSDSGSWALGFDTPTRPDSSSGHSFSDRSVGHLGFTGTSFWVDLLKGVIVILLTNRIHPNRENERIKAFRPVLHDTVMDSIFNYSTRPF